MSSKRKIKKGINTISQSLINDLYFISIFRSSDNIQIEKDLYERIKDTQNKFLAKVSQCRFDTNKKKTYFHQLVEDFNAEVDNLEKELFDLLKIETPYNETSEA